MKINSFTTLAIITTSVLMMSTTTCSGQALQQQQQLRKVSRSQIRCDTRASRQQLQAPLLECSDCFVAAAAAAADGSGDIEEVLRLLQELASAANLDDAYPADVQLLAPPPRSRLQRRLCPVQYELQLYPDTVPAVIVHARCLHSWASGAAATKGQFQCREVTQYRQVYRRLPPDCRIAFNSTATTSTVAVYRKAFVKVNVNCATVDD